VSIVGPDIFVSLLIPALLVLGKVDLVSLTAFYADELGLVTHLVILRFSTITNMIVESVVSALRALDLRFSVLFLEDVLRVACRIMIEQYEKLGVGGHTKG
jgi:hypothetical protein